MSSDSDDLSPSDWNYRNDSRYEPGKVEAVLTLLSIGTGLVLSFSFYITGSPALGLLSLGAGVGIPLIASGQWRSVVEEVKAEYKSGKARTDTAQQADTGTPSKQICGACGWQNPRDNNYCIDCGTRLDVDKSDHDSQ